MKFLKYAASLAAISALAACGSAVDPDKRKPGKWETKVSLEKIELIGAPEGSEPQVAAMKDAIRKGIEGQATQTQCLTAEQAEKEDVAQAMSKATGGNCEFSKENVGNGVIDVAGTCNMGGTEMDIVMEGSLAPEKISMTTSMKAAPKGEGPATQPGMDMVLKTEVTHMGDCDG